MALPSYGIVMIANDLKANRDQILETLRKNRHFSFDRQGAELSNNTNITRASANNLIRDFTDPKVSYEDLVKTIYIILRKEFNYNQEGYVDI